MKRAFVALWRSLTGAHADQNNDCHQNYDVDRAIVDYNKAVELDPNDAKAFNNRANVYGSKGEYDRAIADYDTLCFIELSLH